MAKNEKKNQHRWAQSNDFEAPENDAERTDKLTFEGEITESLRGTLFHVKVADTKSIVLCTIGGKLRQNRIRVLPGDKVSIEVSPYDLSRGRIVWRK